VTKDGFLRLSVDYPNVKFELESGSPERALPEVRRILAALNADRGEDAALAALQLRLTDEFLSNRQFLNRLRSALALDEDVRVLKLILPVEQEYDLESGQARQVVHAKAVIDSLFDPLQGTIRDCYVHLRGELTREQQRAIMDSVRQRVGVDVQPRFFSTHKNLEGKALLEAVCFGDGFASDE